MTAALRVEEQPAPYLVAPLLTDHLGAFASAPEGFKRLRELVLNLAVRGRLVPQDVGDEPASNWLAAKSGASTGIGDCDQPFALPAGWEWVRLGSIGEVGSSSRVHQKDWTTSGVPFYRAREIVRLSTYGCVENELFISEDHFQNLSVRGLVPEAGDLMITGVGTIGVPYVVRETDRFYFKDASVLIFKNRQGVPPNFLFCLMTSPYWIEQTHKGSMGTTVHTLTIGRANEIPVPLPPLAEQSRIVAKVEELMALVDRLEAKVSHGETVRGKLLDALLTALADSPDAAATADAWTQLAPHFDLLLNTPADVDRLQQTLLTLAVKGRLVRQDPNDEPAAELLKHIRAEKERLVSEGKIKPEKSHPVVEESLAHELPATWELVRLSDLLPEFQNGASSRGCVSGESVVVLRLADIDANEISLANTRELVLEVGMAKKYALVAGDILIVRVNGSADIVGKFIPCRASLPVAYCDHFIRMRIRQDWISPDYLALVGKSRLVRDGISDLFITTAGQKTVNQGHIGSLLLPLPPLAEQSRIVAAVASLTALCDRLRERLAARRDLSAKLAAALTEGALS